MTAQRISALTSQEKVMNWFCKQIGISREECHQRALSKIIDEGKTYVQALNEICSELGKPSPEKLLNGIYAKRKGEVKAHDIVIKEAKKKGVSLYQISLYMGKSTGFVAHKIRTPITKSELNEILTAIKEM